MATFVLVTSQAACAVAAPVPPPPSGSSPSSALPEDSPARAFLGTYAFIGGEPERVQVDKAIEKGIASLAPLLRSIARNRLAAANRVPDQLLFLGDIRWFEIRVDGRRYVSHFDGQPYSVETSTGDVMDLRYKFGETLEQSFSDPAKERINTFELRDNQLIMHVRVRANLLPNDINYDLTFERAQPAAAATALATTER